MRALVLTVGTAQAWRGGGRTTTSTLTAVEALARVREARQQAAQPEPPGALGLMPVRGRFPSELTVPLDCPWMATQG